MTLAAHKFPISAKVGGFQGLPRHLVTAAELEREHIDELCALAQRFERSAARRERSGTSVALLFFQPSTRTRLGFEAAATALGCHAIGMQDMSASRSNKRSGETLEDCAAVVSRLCDAIVVRHHEVGAAERMSLRARCPVINAGDGWNEHPTQALIDVFSMRRALGGLEGRTLAFCGDPRGRTVRSLAQLLRHERLAEILFCPPPHVPVPEDILAALEAHQVRTRLIPSVDVALRHADAVMMAPYDMSDIGEPAASEYVSPRLTPDTHRITAQTIALTGSQSLIFHPLPRLDEIDADCDDLPNAWYFEQVRLSKFMRMAVLDRALSIL